MSAAGDDKGSGESREDFLSEVAYFGYAGETNTSKVLELARRRLLERSIGKAVIASETGRSILKAISIFQGSGCRIVAVTHSPDFSCGPKGDIPIGINRSEYERTMKQIESAGVEVVQGARITVSPPRVEWTWNGMAEAVDYTLELLGSGTKVAVEAAVIATEAGKVNPGEEVIAFGGTFKGLDTALVVRAANSKGFFDEFEIREIIAKPRYNVRSEIPYSDSSWKGDIDQYYLA